MTYITKGGVIMKIQEDTFPMWKADGWVLDIDRDGVGDVLVGGAITALLSADTPITAGNTTDLVTLTLPSAGTYLLAPTTSLLAGGTGGNADLACALGTASGTFAGPTSGSSTVPASSLALLNFDAVLIVTTPGTVKMQVRTSIAMTAKQIGATALGLPASGFTAARIA